MSIDTERGGSLVQNSRLILHHPAASRGGVRWLRCRSRSEQSPHQGSPRLDHSLVLRTDDLEQFEQSLAHRVLGLRIGPLDQANQPVEGVLDVATGDVEVCNGQLGLDVVRTGGRCFSGLIQVL